MKRKVGEWIGNLPCTMLVRTQPTLRNFYASNPKPHSNGLQHHGCMKLSKTPLVAQYAKKSGLHNEPAKGVYLFPIWDKQKTIFIFTLFLHNILWIKNKRWQVLFCIGVQVVWYLSRGVWGKWKEKSNRDAKVCLDGSCVGKKSLYCLLDSVEACCRGEDENCATKHGWKMGQGLSWN